MKTQNTSANDTRIALLEQSIAHINETLIRIDKRFDHLEEKFDKRFDEIDKRFEDVDKKFEAIDAKFEKRFDGITQEIREIRNFQWSQFRWLMGTILVFGSALMTTIIKGLF